MKRKKIIRISLYSLLGVIVLAGIGAGYLWYSFEKTMDAMYEPLEEKTWTQPVFERESVRDGDGAEAVTEPSSRATISHEGADDEPSVPDWAASEAPASEEPKTTMAVAKATDDYDRLQTIEGKKLKDEEVKRLLHPDLNHGDPFSILLLGVDERQGDRGRSDTMILLSIQPASNSAVAISIPRDTRVLMPQRESYDKINHAYAYGGSALSVEAVERLFGIPIAYYMKTNMEGLVDIIDTVGGIEIDNQWAFDYDGKTYPLGKQHLNGTEALGFVRMRKEDPKGDFGRTQRQRQVLSATVDQVVSFRSLGKLPHILSQLSQDVRTNLTSGAMLDLATDYRSAIHQVDTLYLDGAGKTINGIYYYTVQPEERQRIQDKILSLLMPASSSSKAQ